jgi:hypothetical protein
MKKNHRRKYGGKEREIAPPPEIYKEGQCRL